MTAPKVIMLIGQGANHRALANRMHATVPLSGIVVRKAARKRKDRSVRKLAEKAGSRLFTGAFGATWRALNAELSLKYPDYPITPEKSVSTINDPAVQDLLNKERPDLVLVSGTNLLSAETIAAASRNGAVMNLHTGISPYVKGGPNCTNWCLATGRPDLVGNTIMWIDPGIDTGSLIATERTPLTGHETLLELHRKVMDHAHDLYCRAARAFVDGRALPNLSQDDVGEGRTFYSREWTMANQMRALRFFRRSYRGFCERDWEEIALVDIESGIRKA